MTVSLIPPETTRPRMAQALSLLLVVGQIVMIVTTGLFLLSAVLLLFPNSLRDQLMTDNPLSDTPGALIWFCLSAAVIALSWYWVLRLLKFVVLGVIHADPFQPENIARLRQIWIVIAVGEVFRMIVHDMTTPEVGGLDIDIRIGTWFFIFVIATIAEAFRHGAALRADQELTI